MKLIARQKIIGITNDEGLRALDGIKYFKADVNSSDELVDLFEKQNPEFRDYDCEILED